MRGILGNVQEWRFGAHRRATRGTPVVLWATITNDVAAARFSTLRKQGETAGYAVTAGKTLYLTRLLLVGGTQGTNITLGYSDADLGFSAAADGANPVELEGVAGTYAGIHRILTSGALIDLEVYYAVPAGKYPRLATPLAAADFLRVQLHGHEE